MGLQLFAMLLSLFGSEADSNNYYTPTIQTRTKSEVESGLVGDRIYVSCGSLEE